MNQALPNFVAFKKPGFFLLLLCMLLAFQRGNAQHCFPGFHASADGNTVTFDDQSTADGNITAYHWDFGDGQTSTEQDPGHTYAVPGTYNVCLVITAENPACTATFCHHVVVAHPPAGVCHAAFAAHQSNPAQQTIEFTDQSTSNGTISSWAWDFGDGQTSTAHSPGHTYAEPGTYLVCLTITDDGGCTSHVCHHVIVHHLVSNACHAAFTVHPGAANLDLQFTNSSSGTGIHTTYSWEFGDGTTSTEENPQHTYAHAGHFTVCLFITDTTTGCTSHSCHTVNVHHVGNHHPHHSQHPQEEVAAAPKVGPNKDRTTPSFRKMSVYPNPAVSAIYVVYQVEVAAPVKFELYSLTGARVLTLEEKAQPAGAYTEAIPVGNLVPGVYMLKITVDGSTQVHRISVQ